MSNILEPTLTYNTHLVVQQKKEDPRIYFMMSQSQIEKLLTKS